MIALLISPDYASHYLPLSAIGHELRAGGAEVVVATARGCRPALPPTASSTASSPSGPGSNAGLIRPDDQPTQEAEQLAAFFAATRQGAVATLRHQAEQRLHDLLWRPHAVTEQLAAIIDELEPGIILSDQLAYGATLALRALERPYATLLPATPQPFRRRGSCSASRPTSRPYSECNRHPPIEPRLTARQVGAAFGFNSSGRARNTGGPLPP